MKYEEKISVNDIRLIKELCNLKTLSRIDKTRVYINLNFQNKESKLHFNLKVKDVKNNPQSVDLDYFQTVMKLIKHDYLKISNPVPAILSDKQFEAYYLREIIGLNTYQIALIQNNTPSTVRDHQSRAIKKIQKMLETTRSIMNELAIFKSLNLFSLSLLQRLKPGEILTKQDLKSLMTCFRIMIKHDNNQAEDLEHCNYKYYRDSDNLPDSKYIISSATSLAENVIYLDETRAYELQK
ncbi:MAG: hypothetical protein ACTSQE_12855 [Candidatus Heimdallarchaeaceae archaeon]